MTKQRGGEFSSLKDVLTRDTLIRDLLSDLPPTPLPARPSQPAPAPIPPAPTAKTSKRMMKRVEGAVRVKQERDEDSQNLGYLAKPFLLCGLPFKKPRAGTSVYERTNGDEMLKIIADPEYGLPFGGDILPIIWVCTLATLAKDKKTGKVPRVVEFKSGRDFLRAFGLTEDGRSYKLAQERFLRVFYSTFYWGKKDSNRAKLYRMHFFDAVDLWFSKDLDTHALPGEDFKNNRIKISEALAEDLEKHAPPLDLEMVKLWADKPGQLFFALWLVFRCFVARSRAEIPLMGPGSVMEQCGAEGYSGEDGPANFKRKVKGWLNGVKAVWRECPVNLAVVRGREVLVIEGHAKAIHPRRPGVDKPKEIRSYARVSGTERNPPKH